MLPDLLTPYADIFQPFNLFNYITFRTGGAVMTALILSLLCGDKFILWLKSQQKRDSLFVQMALKLIF